MVIIPLAFIATRIVVGRCSLRGRVLLCPVLMFPSPLRTVLSFVPDLFNFLGLLLILFLVRISIHFIISRIGWWIKRIYGVCWWYSFRTSDCRRISTRGWIGSFLVPRDLVSFSLIFWIPSLTYTITRLGVLAILSGQCLLAF